MGPSKRENPSAPYSVSSETEIRSPRLSTPRLSTSRLSTPRLSTPRQWFASSCESLKVVGVVEFDDGKWYSPKVLEYHCLLSFASRLLYPQIEIRKIHRSRSKIGGSREWTPKSQSLQKYDPRTNDGTPGPFRVTCPIRCRFTRAPRKRGPKAQS